MPRPSDSFKKTIQVISPLFVIIIVIILLLSTPIWSTDRMHDPAVDNSGRGASTGIAGRKAVRAPAGNGIQESDPAMETSGLEERTKRGIEARWNGTELLPPLPADPLLRDEAIREAGANALSGSAAGTLHSTGGPGSFRGRAGVIPSALNVKHLPLPARFKKMSHTHPAPPDDFGLKSTDLNSGRLGGKPKNVEKPEMDLAPAAIPLVTSFAGMDDYEFLAISNHIVEPPDCDIGVGPDHVITVTNLGYAIYDKCGNLLTEQRYNDFLADTTHFFFDPKVIYDAWDGHWLMTLLISDANTQESYVVLLVSETPDPTGTWHYWYLDFTLDGSNQTNYWADYEDISVDPYGIYITSNQFNFNDSFKYAKIRCLEIYSYTLNLNWWDWWNLKNKDTFSTNAFTIRAAKMHSYSGIMYFINSKSGGGSMMTLWEQTGPPLSPTLTKYKISVNSYDNPPPMPQNDGTFLSTGDARLLNASYGWGQLWTAAGVRVNWGETDDRSGVKVYQVDTSARSLYYESPTLGTTGLYYFFPAVDFDPLGRGIVTFARGGADEFCGTWYAEIGWGGSVSSSSQLSAGTRAYVGFSSNGSSTDPYRWGDYLGCDLDPEDERMFWIYGQHASPDAGQGNWGTMVGALTYEQIGGINVTPTGNSFSTGPVGGPFTPPAITYSLYNPWMVTLYWSLASVDYWNTPSAVSGKLLPHTGTTVDMTINSNANSFAEGTYLDQYSFITCLITSASRGTELTAGNIGECPGATVKLIPNEPISRTLTYDNQQSGVFVTAMQDFNVCAVGIKADLVVPQTITASIYEANGDTRGNLVATGSITAITPGDTINYIPISAALQACKDYDIAVSYGNINSRPDWLEIYLGNPYIKEPFDVGGIIRVRNGETNGDPSSVSLPYISIIGAAACDSIAELKPAAGTPLTYTSYTGGGDRGIYVTPLKTIHVCSLGWKSDLIPGQKLNVKIYDGTGFVRDSLIASGSIDIAAPGEQYYDVPIDAVLEEGHMYDLAISYESSNGWWLYNENDFALPYDVGDVIRVEDGEYYGDVFTTAIAQLRLGWSEAVGYAHFDLAKQGDVYPPPYSSSTPNSRYGMYVTSLIDQAVYSIGWMADIPAGEPITVNIYSATGTARGTLLSSGTTVSAGGGMRWHDVPVTMEFAAATDYDIEVVIPPNVNQWRYWLDQSGMPYQAYGVIEIRNGESWGSALYLVLPHFRMNACNRTLTSVGGEELSGPPAFYLESPYPNPASGRVDIRFGLDKATRASLSIYDVNGRKVAEVLPSSLRDSGPGTAQFDANKLASGVYFVRLEAGKRSLARKMVVLR
jgi:hypothetical protein